MVAKGRRSRAAFGAVVCACLAIAACGGGGGGSSDPQPSNPAPPPPTGATGGLDARPSNTTCIATLEPGFGVSVSSTRVFPNLTFQQPLLILQPPGDATKWYVLQQN